MRNLERVGRALLLLVSVALAFATSARLGTGAWWRGFEPALAVSTAEAKTSYDLTRLEAVNETLRTIRRKYVDPTRIKPRNMLLSALDSVQREVAQVIVEPIDAATVKVTVEQESRTFRVDDVLGPWDVAARLREVFAFLQARLDPSAVDLRALEYAACNGMLRTLDPHSVFLSPEAYREMNVQTSGAFGGLGIVISLRDQQLTVMKPMPGTPAERAGIRRLDRIVQIDGESTLNMPLDDAVRRMRGEPGSKVTLWTTRAGAEGWASPREVPLVREVIKVASVESRSLEGGVGYVKLKNFQATTTEEVREALGTLRAAAQGELRGLVLDLRGNPGGLLEQAVRVADLFVAQGTLVATVGASEGREERKAIEPGTEPDYPIVVLVNGQSASASEILAGALKNLDRALVVGQQSFGKGSVQLVFPDVTPEKAALKLTIAQYLTPGDISIQGVGVVPDIELDPMTVDPLEMDLTVQKDGVRERELYASLTNDAVAPASRPLEVVRYQRTAQEREADRDPNTDDDQATSQDFPARFARELALAVPRGKPRLEQLVAARQHVERVRADELAKVAAELSAVGIDWSPAAANAGHAKRSELDVRATLSEPSGEVVAGGSLELRVSVKNRGTEPIVRLRAQTESESGYFDAKELVFGRIGPGEEKTASVPFGWCEIEGKKAGSTIAAPPGSKRVCRIPLDAGTRSDGVTVRFEADGEAPLPTEVRPTVRALPRPKFEYALQVIDDRGGNGDGRLQRGERASVYLSVTNSGTGAGRDVQANLSNLSGDGLMLKAGRFDLGALAPGATRKVVFTFDVSPSLRDPEAVVQLSVVDRELGESAREKLTLPIEPPASLVEERSVRTVGPGGATLRTSPSSETRGFGTVRSGTAVSVLGRAGEYAKVSVEGARYAFVLASELVDGGGSPAAALVYEELRSHAPPALEVESASLATREPTVKLRGVASSASELLDFYVVVGGRKVHYRSNRGASDPSRASIDLEVPLKPGMNGIQVVARAKGDVVTRRTITVRRDDASGALLPTPHGADLDDWLSSPTSDDD
jgi:carboxyl-terminal processing protease